MIVVFACALAHCSLFCSSCLLVAQSFPLRFHRLLLIRPSSLQSNSFAVSSAVIMDLDESLMNFVNVLGITIFGAIALFHFVQSAAKNQ
jgi:hypothetical protein